MKHVFFCFNKNFISHHENLIPLQNCDYRVVFELQDFEEEKLQLTLFN